MPVSTRAVCAAYQRRCPDGHFFSHLTAAALWGAPLPWTVGGRPLDVAVLKPLAKPRSAAVIGHRFSDERIMIVRRRGLRVSDPASTWCHRGLLSLDDLVAAGDHLVLTPRYQRSGERRPYVGLPEFLDRVQAFRGPGASRLRAASLLVRDGAASHPETVLRLAIRDADCRNPS